MSRELLRTHIDEYPDGSESVFEIWGYNSEGGTPPFLALHGFNASVTFDSPEQLENVIKNLRSAARLMRSKYENWEQEE